MWVGWEAMITAGKLRKFRFTCHDPGITRCFPAFSGNTAVSKLYRNGESLPPTGTPRSSSISATFTVASFNWSDIVHHLTDLTKGSKNGQSMGRLGLPHYLFQKLARTSHKRCSYLSPWCYCSMSQIIYVQRELFSYWLA